MYIKKHSSEGREVLAVSDENLIGKTFKDEKGLKLEVSERFYKGEKAGKERVIEELKKAENINIIGEESIKAAIETGVITEEHVINIGGVPHALIFQA